MSHTESKASGSRFVVSGGRTALYADLLRESDDEAAKLGGITTDLGSKTGSGGSLEALSFKPEAGSVSRAPVLYQNQQQQRGGESGRDQNDEDEASLTSKLKRHTDASLRFQPTKRPQLAKHKTKPPAVSSKFQQDILRTGTTDTATNTVATGKPVKSSIEDWISGDGDGDDNGFMEAMASTVTKPTRGGRKGKKQGVNSGAQYTAHNWDDIYDPTRPTSYEEYQRSEERLRDIAEWKNRLYAHKKFYRTTDYGTNSESDVEDNMDYRPNRQFAPPSEYNFAPPAELGSSVDSKVKGGGAVNFETGEDAYLNRLRLSKVHDVGATVDTLREKGGSRSPTYEEREGEYEELSDETKGKEREELVGVISKGPARYEGVRERGGEGYTERELNEREQDLNGDEDDVNSGGGSKNAVSGSEGRSKLPGQKGFAKRLLEKYGWVQGSGLGASGSGIVKPLRVKVEKQRKRTEHDSGGKFMGAGGKGKIIGEQIKASEGKFGRVTEVIRMEGMLVGKNVEEVMGELEDGLLQEIGEECSEKYGSVERVHVWTESATAQESGASVFVKFTNQLSALRAVNALDGRLFAGNPISARFFDVEKFEKRKFTYANQ